MSEVIDFGAERGRREAAKKEASKLNAPVEPSWEGPCVCIGCRHEWTGTGKPGQDPNNIKCPKCELPKGTPKYPFGSAPGDAVLTCLVCDNEALTAYIRDGYHHVICMGCGNDLTEVFFSDE